MTASTTHDTKRSEDARARIAVLAEIPGEWETALDELLRLAPLPDPAFGSLLWQAVLGAWPAVARRALHAYAEKAMREAGDRDHLGRARRGLRGRRARAPSTRPSTTSGWPTLLGELSDRIDGPACSNALAAKLVALTMPGVPDVYQGTELWDQSLVDPDNRRPVDFAHRAAVLDGAEDPAWLKLAVVLSALTLRRDRPELFTTYAPVAATGEAAEHVLAFDRGGVVAVATRLPVGLAARGWGDTELALPAGTWTDVLTGRPAVGAAGRPARRRTPSRCWCDGLMTRGPFDVWAPVPQRVRARSAGDAIVDMARDDDGWWAPDQPVPRGRGRLRLPARRRPASPGPTRGRGASPTARTGCSRTVDLAAYEWGDGDWTGRELAGLGRLRAARRDVHARGHARRRGRAARPPARPRASASSS